MAKTYVQWDVKDCPIPPGLSASDVLVNIETVLKKSGHYGRVSIMPFGDLDHLKNDFVGIPVSILDSEGQLLTLYFQSQSLLLIYLCLLYLDLRLYIYGFRNQRG